ncbi:hypothetical protein QF042_003415 [Pedobacter sp. W3I1]|nr:hypothetical protein [Pedobacter sp. W3I1]
MLHISLVLLYTSAGKNKIKVNRNKFKEEVFKLLPHFALSDHLFQGRLAVPMFRSALQA